VSVKLLFPLAAALLLLLGWAAWWVMTGGNGARALAGAEFALPAPHLFLIALVAGMVGGLAGASLSAARAGRASEELHSKIDMLKRKLGQLGDEVVAAQQTADTAYDAAMNRNTPEPQIVAPATNRQGPDEAAERQPPPPPAARPDQAAATMHPAPLPRLLNGVMESYAQLMAPPMSRSKFDRFFEDLGRSGAVSFVKEGCRLVTARGSAGFLTGVSVDLHVLVFPSFNFIANAETQFATIASVPAAVAELFELQRGSGIVTVERPAIFREDTQGPVLQEKGIIGGFPG
jgi:outer membrane murein-binding lipoprotein Lpp